MGGLPARNSHYPLTEIERKTNALSEIYDVLVCLYFYYFHIYFDDD